MTAQTTNILCRPAAGPHAVRRRGPVVFLSAVQYHLCLSGRTRHLADVLSGMGTDVHFVQMPSVKAGWMRTFGAELPDRGPSGLHVHHLVALPKMLLRSPLATGLWARAALDRLSDCVPGLDQAAVIVSTPFWWPLARLLPRRCLIYDCIDHVSVHAGPGRRLLSLYEPWQKRLMGMSDLIFTVSEGLRDSLIAQSVPPERVLLAPNGVPEAWLDLDVASLRRSSPARVAGAGRAVIGFLGAMYEWVDLQLLEALARRMPDADLVLVGPARRGVGLTDLKALPNVRVFGPQDHADVPRWIAGFDVCLIPFKPDMVSRLADPVKLYEYLALGKPVVSTLPFKAGADSAPIVAAQGPDAIAEAIRRELAGDSDALCRRRRDFAREQTWTMRARQIVEAIDKILR